MKAIVAGACLGMAVMPARAQERPVKFTGDIGLVNVKGNTDLTTVNVGDKLEVRAGKLLFTQTFALVYGKSEGEVTANSQLARVRGDYSVGDGLGVFLQAGYERNRFAGIARRLSQDAGIAVTIWRSEHNELDGEAGLGLIQERRLPDPELDATVNEEFLSGRAAVRYKHLFTAAAYVQQSLEFLPNLEETSDFRINSETSLVAPLSSHFALKVGYLIRFNNAPPAPELKKTDRMLTTGLQASW